MVQILPILCVLCVMGFVYLYVEQERGLLREQFSTRKPVPAKRPFQEVIAKIRRQNPREPLDVIKLYTYHNQKTFLVYTSGDPDAIIRVYDENGNYMGSPSGGVGWEYSKRDGALRDYHRDTVFIRELT